jgi:putative SOS response-associated peptidase YedK
MHWGLVPHWFNGNNPETIASKTLNARIETIHEKASFKTLINRNRCIIPSSGFFEYQHQGREKIPFCIKPTNDEVFSMAGLFDEWLDRTTGELSRSFTIITTEANELMAKIHNTKQRMPLILSITDVTAYLNPQNDISQFSPIPQEEMNAFKIDKRIIQSPFSNVPDVQQAVVDNIGIQTRLF